MIVTGAKVLSMAGQTLSFKVCTVGDGWHFKSRLSKAIIHTFHHDGVGGIPRTPTLPTEYGGVGSPTDNDGAGDAPADLTFAPLQFNAGVPNENDDGEMEFRFDGILCTTPGQRYAIETTANLCAGACAVLFVFDVRDRTSFDHILEWIEAVERVSHVPVKVIIGVSSDDDVGTRAKERQVETAQAIGMCARVRAQYFDVSGFGEDKLTLLCRTLKGLIVDTVPPGAEAVRLIGTGMELHTATHPATTH